MLRVLTQNNKTQNQKVQSSESDNDIDYMNNDDSEFTCVVDACGRKSFIPKCDYKRSKSSKNSYHYQSLRKSKSFIPKCVCYR